MEVKTFDEKMMKRLKEDAMNEAQLFLMKAGLPDKYVGTMSKTENGMVIVDGGLVYVSDLMMAWAKRVSSSNKE